MKNIIKVIILFAAINASAYVYPPKDCIIADFADDGDAYLVQDNGSIIGDASRLFQHARCANGEASFAYEIPVNPNLERVFVAFEEKGECRVKADGVQLLNEGSNGTGEWTSRQYVLTDPALWLDGKIVFEFADSEPADGDGPRITWLECGSTTRFRERLMKVQPGTQRILWSFGAWDGRPAEFMGSERRLNITMESEWPVGTILPDPAFRMRGNRRLWVTWKPQIKSGMRYYVILGYRGSGSIDAHADGSVELESEIRGLEALNYDITDRLLKTQGGDFNLELRGTSFIDYAALVEVSPAGDPIDQERIGFGGTPEAVNHGKVLNNSLFWVLNSHYEKTGFVDASPVGGHWYQQYWPIDISTALRELVGWGYLDESESVARLCARVAWAGHKTNRSGSSDNTAGNLIVMDMVNILKRRAYDSDVVDALWPRVTEYLDQTAGDIDSSTWHLVRGANWENAGNRAEGPCMALSTNMGLYLAYLSGAEAAVDMKDNDRAVKYKQYAAKIRAAMLEHLLLKEDLDMGNNLIAPAGTWKYGLAMDGQLFQNPLAGWAWAGFFGCANYGLVDPDRELRDIMSRTEDFRQYIRTTPGMFEAAGLTPGYEGELDWTLTVLMSDKPELYGYLLSRIEGGLTDYREDRGAEVCELSPWAIGGPGDTEDTNLVGTGVFLGSGRIAGGVDDTLYEGAPLRILPRLPWDWTSAHVNHWPVQFKTVSGGTAFGEVSYRFKRSNNRAEIQVTLSGNAAVGAPVQVRLGPFPLATKSLSARLDGQPVPCRMEKSGTANWAWVDITAGGTVSAMVRAKD